LVNEDGLSTAAIRATDSQFQRVPSGQLVAPEAIATSDSLLSLHVVRTGQILPLMGRSEFTLGRISEGQSILPDIDLTPYEAYSQGVSRLHATIRINPEKVMITDLGSSNGTRLNEEKLQPHRETQLEHGDMIVMGRFKIQVLIRQD
jgi:pSer/pThr/pTyr-binding forkhead associated (FHA) protein